MTSWLVVSGLTRSVSTDVEDVHMSLSDPRPMCFNGETADEAATRYLDEYGGAACVVIPLGLERKFRMVARVVEVPKP